MAADDDDDDDDDDDERVYCHVDGAFALVAPQAADIFVDRRLAAFGAARRVSAA